MFYYQKNPGSSLVYCSDTLKSKIQMEIIKGHYTAETKRSFYYCIKSETSFFWAMIRSLELGKMGK